MSIQAMLYILGIAVTWRYAVGALIHEMSMGYKIEGEDIFFGLIFGTLVSLFWPLIWVFRAVFVLWTKYGKDNTGVLVKIFPPAKQVETRAQRERRISRERQKQITEHRNAINSRERELGLEPTKW